MIPKSTTTSKSGFAALCGVNPSQVTRWIDTGLLSGAAIVGDGRSARINVEVAQAQLAKRRDPGQALGNGAKTKVGPTAPAAPKTSRGQPKRKPPPQNKPRPASLDDADGEPEDDDLDYAAQRARLAKAQADAQEMKNAIARGEMEHADAIAARWNEIALRFRSCMLAVPARVREGAPHFTPSDIALVDTEIRRGLKDASLGPPS